MASTTAASTTSSCNESYAATQLSWSNMWHPTSTDICGTNNTGSRGSNARRINLIIEDMRITGASGALPEGALGKDEQSTVIFLSSRPTSKSEGTRRQFPLLNNNIDTSFNTSGIRRLVIWSAMDHPAKESEGILAPPHVM